MKTHDTMKHRHTYKICVFLYRKYAQTHNSTKLIHTDRTGRAMIIQVFKQIFSDVYNISWFNKNT